MLLCRINNVGVKTADESDSCKDENDNHTKKCVTNDVTAIAGITLVPHWWEENEGCANKGQLNKNHQPSTDAIGNKAWKGSVSVSEFVLAECADTLVDLPEVWQVEDTKRHPEEDYERHWTVWGKG